jgi:hypothetical protein
MARNDSSFRADLALSVLIIILLAAAPAVVLVAAGWQLADGRSGSGYRLGRCLFADHALSRGALARDGDFREGFCRRPIEEAALTRPDIAGRYAVKPIEEGHRLALADFQAEPFAPLKTVRILVKVPDGRAACLGQHDRVLLVETAGTEGKERAVIPSAPLHPAEAGFEILEPPFKAVDNWLITVAVPAELTVEAARISLGEWSPVVLKREKHVDCQKPQ